MKWNNIWSALNKCGKKTKEAVFRKNNTNLRGNYTNLTIEPIENKDCKTKIREYLKKLNYYGADN